MLTITCYYYNQLGNKILNERIDNMNELKFIATEQDIIDAGITLYKNYDFSTEAIEFFKSLGLTEDQIENDLENTAYGWAVTSY